MAYERGSAELVKSCKRICEILETGAQRGEHTGLKRYLPKSPWMREIAYKVGVPQGYSVYLTHQERQELKYHYMRVSGSMRGMEKSERPSLLQQVISKAYEMRKGEK
ncbi:MAG TPA: hypothetical protein VJ485_03165 [archaeon]|jgi:hypothetical protein|nr:hypothetical protein [archaeon]